MLTEQSTENKVHWDVEGMDCNSCAVSINNYLTKKGMHHVNVNALSGEVNFIAANNTNFDELKKGISKLGYSVANTSSSTISQKQQPFLKNNKQRFFFCLPFTAILMLHMFDKWWHLHWLMNPYVQLSLCLPVMFIGLLYFGKSAIKSLLAGSPNMNVLIAIGAIAAFLYSCYGVFILKDVNYMFFETAASVITLVFLGNYLEEVTTNSTLKVVNELTASQKVMANMIAFDDKHTEQIFAVENNQLQVGDLILIKTGEQVPIDCKILWGECSASEAIISGESTPISKQKKDVLIGGSVIENGIVKAQVTAVGGNTVLSRIIEMVKQAQAEKPPMQKLADKISAVFVPAVLAIALITFLLNHFLLNIDTTNSLMRAIAVLVISCPCAMGLATPAAISVGLGRGAKKGILYKNSSALENFKNIKQVVFDKTGTLTTGKFSITDFFTTINEEYFRQLVYSLEKFSTHPVASAIVETWKNNTPIHFKKIEEIKGLGIKAEDMNGNILLIGSSSILKNKKITDCHNIYLTKNDELLGWIDVADEIRPEAKQIIEWLKSKNIKTILLSGDKEFKCKEVAEKLRIDEYYAEQNPQQKLIKIEALNNQQPTAMIGDGINDAPSLAKATIGVSLSSATQIAIQNADVILLRNGLNNFPLSLQLGKATYTTIKQNLFWAFAYNIVAIPVAACGFLSPTVGVLAMAFSDVILGINSIKLAFVKII